MKNLHAKLCFYLLVILFGLSLNLKAQAPVYFDPQAVEATLNLNDTAVVYSILRNQSEDTVEFYFPGYTSKGQGGPDDFGYSWIDSDEDGGPNWEWSDISETGTAVEGLFDDNIAGPFEIGFTFPFYGQEKNHFWISANGVISFNEQFVTFVNTAIPTNNNYTDFIAWFWDDLLVDSVSSIYIQHYDAKVVVQFDHVVHYPGSDATITGQIILVNNGQIFFRYRQVSEAFESNSATIGLQSANPAVGLQVAFNQEYAHSELAVRFDVNRSFITHVQPSTLTLPPGTQEHIWVTYSSEGYSVGSYEQELQCATNLPDYPNLYLHNVMHVVNPEQAGFQGYVTDAATGYALNDVLVQVGDHQVYTNDNGWYQLPLDQGSYNVQFSKEGYQPRTVEDTTALPGYTDLVVTLEPLEPTYFLVGRVYAGDNYLETGFAYGYKMIEGTVVDIYAEMVGEEGWYEFTGLAPANYIVKTEPSPNSQYYGDYLPTYYGDVLHWEDATVIELSGNTDGMHIHLVQVTAEPQGPCSISGTIATSGKAADVPVILRTVDPPSALMTLTGSDGSYSFDNLPYGSYELFAEILGKSTTAMNIVLDAGTPAKENIDMLVTENQIIFTGIGESDVFEYQPYIYPNPVSERINISLNLKKLTTVNVEITDISGRVVNVQDYTLDGKTDLSLDASSLSKGIYFIRINTDNESATMKVLKD
jgi:hypothetical protein